MSTSKRSRSWSQLRWSRTAARIALSVAALGWVLHSTPFRAITSALTSAQIVLFVAGFGLNFLARCAAAERTLVISRGLGLWISRWQTIETLFISNFYALLSPGPILSGAVTVYRYHGFGAPMSASLGSLLASRIVECVAFVMLGTVCALADSEVSLANIRYPVLLAAAGLSLAALALGAWWLLHRRWIPQSARRGTPTDSGHGFLADLRAVRDEVMRRGPALVLRATVPACAQALLAGAATALLARSVGIELTMLTAMWLTAAVYAVVLLPISVAGLGVREVTLTKALGLLGVHQGPAVALSILLFADPVINALIGGALQLRAAFTGVQRQT